MDCERGGDCKCSICGARCDSSAAECECATLSCESRLWGCQDHAWRRSSDLDLRGSRTDKSELEDWLERRSSSAVSWLGKARRAYPFRGCHIPEACAEDWWLAGRSANKRPTNGLSNPDNHSRRRGEEPDAGSCIWTTAAVGCYFRLWRGYATPESHNCNL